MKRLTKSNNKVISGVCAGVAEYFNIDPAIVRILWVLLSFGGGTGVILYIVCSIILPNPYGAYHDQYDDHSHANHNSGFWNSPENYNDNDNRN